MRHCWLPLSQATLLVAQLSQRWGSLVSASCVPASPSSRYQPSCTAQHSTVQYSASPPAQPGYTEEEDTPGHLQPRVALEARGPDTSPAYPPPPLRQRGVVLAGTCGHPPHTAAMLCPHSLLSPGPWLSADSWALEDCREADTMA